jgi:hypothetical protein
VGELASVKTQIAEKLDRLWDWLQSDAEMRLK